MNIARTTQRITRALCALCQASADGVELTEEAIMAYRLSQDAANGDTSMLLLDEQAPIIEGLKKFSLATLSEGMSRAVWFLKRKVQDDGESARIAKKKKRRPLLEGLQDGDVLGDMNAVDRMLTKD